MVQNASDQPKTTTITEERRAVILAQQQADWPKHLQGAEMGNPYATLCWHCFGRHVPPKDEICPRRSPNMQDKLEMQANQAKQNS